MAISYTVSYTFSPNTTISSSQINTNFSDNANTWTGIEALTKTFAKIKVDVDPATALEVATKQYVDHYSAYRRPVLQYSSGTVVNVETAINGSSSQAAILFPDGNLRTDSTATRINCNLAQVAALSGSAQSGLRTGSQAANTWYAFYAVKTTDNSSNFVTVADTVLPIQANFATLNSNFGTNGWVYLGVLRNGDNAGSTGVINQFKMTGNFVRMTNAWTLGNTTVGPGIRWNDSASAASLSYTNSAGTGNTNVPNNILLSTWWGSTLAGGAKALQIGNGDSPLEACVTGGVATVVWAILDNTLNVKIRLTDGSATSLTLAMTGYWDSVLGVGSNPIL